MKTIVLSFFILSFLSANMHAQQAKQDFVQLSEPVKETTTYRVFGSSYDEKRPIVQLDSLIIKANAFDKQIITTKGTIAQVCQKKGCFFILENNGRNARISFKDYSFFIPTNTTGSQVMINGIFNVKVISEEDARHYAKDAGEDPDKISGPQKEYMLTATSVKIYK